MVKFFKRFLYKREIFELCIRILLHLFFLSVSLGIYIYKYIDFIDISVLTAGLMVLTIEFLTKFLSRRLYLRREDKLKTASNYTWLMNYYPLDKPSFYQYYNSKTTDCALLKKENNKTTDCALLKKEIKKSDEEFDFQQNQVFPIKVLANLKGKALKIQDSDKIFVLPKELQKNLNRLDQVHLGSKLYNNQCHRLDDVRTENDLVVLQTSRTSYFDFCASNRMMDYDYRERRSVRQQFAYGPKFPSLRKSQLSNLLGFNVSIISSDNKVIFIKRSKKESIEKGCYANGVQAVLKYQYTHENHSSLTPEGLCYAVKREIMDELKIKDELKITNTEIQKSLQTIYYDYVEGKPQLYFEIKLPEPWTFEYWKKIFENTNSTDKSKDRKEVIGIDIERLEEIFVTPYGFSFDCKFYPMVPSSSYCVAQLIENHKNSDEKIYTVN